MNKPQQACLHAHASTAMQLCLQTLKTHSTRKPLLLKHKAAARGTTAAKHRTAAAQQKHKHHKYTFTT
jgi:hypothetical protein